MLDKKIIHNIRNFIAIQNQGNRKVHFYQEAEHPMKYFQNIVIGVELYAYKDVILQEETGLELGGMNKKSFLLIYPLREKNLLSDGRVTLIGPEIQNINESNIDFGVLLLLKLKQAANQKFKDLSSFTFISNSIEGFSIRSIPRRFWSRISKSVLNKGFSFLFLANAIFYLYRVKFNDLIEAMELIFISSYSDSIDEFLSTSSDLTHSLNEKWLKKLDKWKKRIDCEYDWGCEICPYQIECYDIKKVLSARNKREESQEDEEN
jgi:CO dehydrogenase/acetyl-CoA synthase beta subunit